MNVDFQLLFNGLFAIAMGMGGWIMGRITKSLDTLDKDVRAMPEKYVAKVDYRSDIHDIKGLLERISDKLDGKADKP
jgi:hypothetical protein